MMLQPPQIKISKAMQNVYISDYGFPMKENFYYFKGRLRQSSLTLQPFTPHCVQLFLSPKDEPDGNGLLRNKEQTRYCIYHQKLVTGLSLTQEYTQK